MFFIEPIFKSFKLLLMYWNSYVMWLFVVFLMLLFLLNCFPTPALRRHVVAFLFCYQPLCTQAMFKPNPRRGGCLMQLTQKELPCYVKLHSSLCCRVGGENT